MDMQIVSDQSVGVHVYRVSAGNKAAFVVLSLVLFCVALFVPYHHMRHGLNTTAVLRRDLITLLPLLGIALFMAIRVFQMRVTITKSQVEVVGAFFTSVIPFTEISGCRFADGRGGILLYRRGKSRVWVRGWLQQDDFYRRWKDSIYDLDMADRLQRKAIGKERIMDYLLGADDREQHPVIGGPDIIA
jgi:hypothetical protein